MQYLGDFADDSTVRLFFSTSAASGAAVAPSSGFEAADVVIYKGSSATQKATTNGITMTSPFDAVTGLHLVEIDCSVDTGDAGFWATGNDYSVVLSPDETVDSQSVVAALAQFSIENRVVSAVSGNVAGISGTINTLDALDTAQDGQHSTTQAAITALNDFDPAVDTVASVTSVGAVSGNVAGSVGSLGAQAKLDVNAEVDTALADYDAPTKAELDAGLAALNDFDPASDVVASVTTVGSVSGSVTVGSIAANAVNASSLAADAVTEMQSGLATASAQTTAQADLDVITGTDGVTLASSQANYAPATASALSSVSTNVDAVLTDTGTTLPGTLATISGKIDTVDAICDQVLDDTSTGVAISTAQAQAVADEVLKRSVSNVESGAAEHTLATIVLAILESSRSSTTWTIKRTDGLTTHSSKVLTLDDTAKPVVGVN